MTIVSVAIPVGPSRTACRYLSETLGSLTKQTRLPDQVVIVDDMHYLDIDFSPRRNQLQGFIWHPPWRLGVPGAFNAGVAISSGDLCIMLGADDWLEPAAIEELVDAFEANGKRDAYYYFTIRYSDTGEVQDAPCNFAAVTPGLWRKTGGFPPESAIGACDTMLISILLTHMPDALVPVARGTPLANYRSHQDTDSSTRPAAWQGPIFIARDILTAGWKPPEWGRYQW